jgi:hypothetical protein
MFTFLQADSNTYTSVSLLRLSKGFLTTRMVSFRVASLIVTTSINSSTFERYVDIRDTIAREKQLKRWSRIKKTRLIVAMNPDWKDLSEEWGKPIEPFRELQR